MCIRRKKRYYNTNPTVSKKTQTPKKRKRPSCCVRCLRKICGFFCRRIKRRIKKEIFGTANPHLDDYEIAGLDLDKMKEKITPTFNRISLDSIKDTFDSTLDRFDFDSIKNRIGSYYIPSSLSKLNTVVTLFKNKRKFSKINMSVKNLDLIEGLEFEELKKKYSIKGSKERLLEKLVHDYKKGNISSSGLSNDTKFDIKSLDKEKLNKMLETYAEKSKTNRLSLAELIAQHLQNKTSLSSFKRGKFENFMQKFKKGELSKSTTSKIFKLNARKLSKKEISAIIRTYEEQEKKNKGVTFARSSKLEQFKSAVSSYFGKAY